MGSPLLPRNCRSYESRRKPLPRHFGISLVEFGFDPNLKSVVSDVEPAKIQNFRSGKARRVGQMLKPGDLSDLPQQPLSWVKEVSMKVHLLFLGFLFLPVSVRGAQAPEPTLPPVFVTSTRTETPLQEVTTSASVVVINVW